MTSCSLQADAGNITSSHSLHVHIGSKNSMGVWHVRNEAVDMEVGRELASFAVLAGCHEQVVPFGRLQVTSSLQRTCSMRALDPRIAGASGTHATKLWIEVGRETCQLPCTCSCHGQAVLFKLLQGTSLYKSVVANGPIHRPSAADRRLAVS